MDLYTLFINNTYLIRYKNKSTDRQTDRQIYGGFKMARSMTYRIKEMLQEKGISQKELAELTGLTESAISHYVKGDRVPRGTNLVKIANALGTTTDDLLSGDKEMDKEKDLIFAKSLIARNATKMTQEEKMDFIALLLNTGGVDEAK